MTARLGLTDVAAFVGSQADLTAGYDGDGVLRVLDRCPAPLTAARTECRGGDGGGARGRPVTTRRALSACPRTSDPTVRGRRGSCTTPRRSADLLARGTPTGHAPDHRPARPRFPTLPTAHRPARHLPAELTTRRISNPTYLDGSPAAAIDKAFRPSGAVAPAGHAATPWWRSANGEHLGPVRLRRLQLAPATRARVCRHGDLDETRANDDDGVAWALCLLSTSPSGEGGDSRLVGPSHRRTAVRARAGRRVRRATSISVIDGPRTFRFFRDEAVGVGYDRCREGNSYPQSAAEMKGRRAIVPTPLWPRRPSAISAVPTNFRDLRQSSAVVPFPERFARHTRGSRTNRADSRAPSLAPPRRTKTPTRRPSG
jgi:hypothetical protein